MTIKKNIFNSFAELVVALIYNILSKKLTQIDSLSFE